MMMMDPGSTSTPMDQFVADRVTGVAIDGNSIVAAAVSMGDGGEAVVHAVQTIELDSLVEKVERETHPIFMDVNHLRFGPSSVIRAALVQILSNEAFRNPLVGVFPADCVKNQREWGPSGAEARRKRVNGAIHASASAANPYRYPRILGVRSEPALHGGEFTDVWSARLEDFVACMEQFRKLGPPLLGLATGKRALAEAARLVQDGGEAALTLIDVGKLRSIYAGASGGATRFVHAIPVGLARDDMHYFSSLPPRMDKVVRLSQEIGTLFYPPDATASPLFDGKVRSPQADSTRLGVQIARFAWRVLGDIWKDEFQWDGPMNVALCGGCARMPGLAEYVSGRLGMPLRRLDASPVPGMRLAGSLGWPEVVDHLLPIGAAQAWFRRERDRFGLLLRDRRPVRMSSVEQFAGDWSDDSVYVILHPPQSGSKVAVPKL